MYGESNKSYVNPMLDKELKSYFQSLLNIDSLLMNIALSIELKHMHIQPVPWLASLCSGPAWYTRLVKSMLLKQFLNSFLSYKLYPEKTVAEGQKSDSCHSVGKLLNCSASWAMKGV